MLSVHPLTVTSEAATEAEAASVKQAAAEASDRQLQALAAALGDVSLPHSAAVETAQAAVAAVRNVAAEASTQLLAAMQSVLLQHHRHIDGASQAAQLRGC